MGSYVLPQVRVFQEFALAPNDVTQNLNPFVIGPNYQLMRYSEEDERSYCSSVAFAGTDATVAWSTKGDTGSVIDKTYYGVTLVDVYANISDSSITPTCLDASSGKGTKFEFSLDDGKSLTGTSSLQYPVAIKAGDYLAYLDDTEYKFTKIRDITVGTAESGEIETKVTNRKTGATFTGFDLSATEYTGEKDVTVYVTVTKEGTGDAATYKATWSSTADIKSTEAATLSTTTATELGKGIKLKATATIAEGTYAIVVKIKEGYSSDTVTTADIVPTGKAFWFVRHVDSVDVDSAYLTPTDTGVTIDGNATVDLGASTMFKVLKSTAYLNQRNFVKSYADGVYSVSSDTDIVNKLGAITPDNPLAYAAHVMLLNCATATIKFMAVESDDLEGYSKALDLASITTDVYAFCPLTDDRTIIDAVVAHCNKMSAADEKAWRIAFFSAPTEGENDITPNVEGVPERCRVDSTNKLTCYNGTTTNASSVANFTETVRVGDTVKVTNSNAVVTETTVASVLSNNTLMLAASVANAADANCRFTITHKLSTAEYVTAIATTSTSFKDRRAYNVFPNSMKNTDGVYVSGMYGAAAVCALACSVLPQQPITNVEINGFSDLPDVYGKYSRDQLNEIAGGGTLILMQDKIGGSVYVRHQISTAYTDGNLNTTELSLTKNLDSISFYFANLFAPYIGRYNITEALIGQLKTELSNGLSQLETVTEGLKLIGPQIIADGTEIRSIYQDATEKDKVYADVALNLPAPFNNFDLHLSVI